MSRISVESLTHSGALAAGRGNQVSGKSRCLGKLRYVDKTAIGEPRTIMPVYRCIGCGSYLGISGGAVMYDGAEPQWVDWADDQAEADAATDGTGDPGFGP